MRAAAIHGKLVEASVVSVAPIERSVLVAERCDIAGISVMQQNGNGPSEPAIPGEEGPRNGLSDE